MDATTDRLAVHERTAGLAGFALVETVRRDLENAVEFAQALEDNRTESKVEELKDQLKLVGETVAALDDLDWGLGYDTAAS